MAMCSNEDGNVATRKIVREHGETLLCDECAYRWDKNFAETPEEKTVEI